MGCNCNEKIINNVSTRIVEILPDLVRGLYHHDMVTNETATVTDDEWKAFFYILNLFCIYKLINIKKYKKEFEDLGGCTLCFDNTIDAICNCGLAEKNSEKTSLFLSAKKRD